FPPDSGYSVGDTVKVILPDGSTREVPLADNDGDGQVDDVVVPFTPLPEGQKNEVTAVVTDTEGNESQTGKDEAV
ncbi:hypothetical protein ACLSYY_11055, partial [[Pasteurella] aerogenes]